MSAENILEVKKLSKNYGKLKAVKGISFNVAKGEIFGILGPNGAGKTTTLEMIEGLRPIDGGRAILNGLDVASNSYAIKEIIGIQLQSSAFFDRLSLTELLKLFGDLYDQKVHPRELLEEVELLDKAKSYVKNLSGGQKQRFSIAAALVNRPIALFLDEPTTGLDPQARRHLWDLIAAIRKRGITIIITTHYMDEAEILCDRVAIMDGGKIISLDTPKTLIQKLIDTGFKGKHKFEAVTLEDVFIKLTGRGLRE